MTGTGGGGSVVHCSHHLLELDVVAVLRPKYSRWDNNAIASGRDRLNCMRFAKMLTGADTTTTYSRFAVVRSGVQVGVVLFAACDTGLHREIEERKKGKATPTTGSGQLFVKDTATWARKGQVSTAHCIG